MPVDPNSTPKEFVQALRALGLRRALFCLDDATGRLETKKSALSSVASAMSDNTRDFAQHAAVCLEVGAETGALFAAFLHKVRRGQGAGGVRHWRYDTLNAFLTDGLRLSRGMGRKNSLAGLWWGGGKGIICQQPDAPVTECTYRRQLYTEYGAFITSLRGAYITAEDVGTSAEDMRAIHRATRFATCVPEDVGGSGNPSRSTARGVVCAMEAALDFAGRGDLTGKVVAMQGTGNVGRFMIEALLERGVKRIVAAEISEASARTVRQSYQDSPLEVRTVSANDTSIFTEPCDVFAPNALGGVLHERTISLLQTPVVCGAANNQLLNEDVDGRLLAARGIVFVPDFVANRMGIVQCANEQYGSLPDDPAIARHFDPNDENSVFRVTQRVLRRARDEGTTPTLAANRLADDLSERDHPMWPGRTQQIIDALRVFGWEDGHA